MKDSGRHYDIVGISDVSLGYGSPQIPALMQSLANYYFSKALIIEPDQVNRKPFSGRIDGCDIRRISQTTDPHTSAGRQEYIIEAAEEINKIRPDILVVFCTYSLPVLLKLKYKPRFILYSSLESIEAYGHFDIALNRSLASQIDAVIFPEENRARLDSERCQLFDIPSVIMYNAVNGLQIEGVKSIDERMKRIIYSGTIDRERTLAAFFLENEIKKLPIDIYGSFSGAGREEIRNAMVSNDVNIRYKGYIEASKLSEIRKKYAFSLVLWNPSNENQLYACPNKFFDAIADGVPPVITPHPQASMLVKRYGCGIVMDDWSYQSFLKALKQAFSIFGTERYFCMVDSCREAVVRELNWEHQFNKLMRLLPEPWKESQE